MTHLVTISNGVQLFRIPEAELSGATKRGFYRPAERGRTIVSDGRQILEIDARDLSLASAEGFVDVTNTDRERHSKVDSATLEARNDQGSEPSIYRQAELERERHLARLLQRSEEASFIGKVPARCRLWWARNQDGVFRILRTHGLSAAIHVAVLLLLSILIVVDPSTKNPAIITVSTDVDVPVEEVVIEQVEFETEEPLEEPIEEFSESMESVTEVTETMVSIDVSDTMDSGFLSAPESSDRGAGDGMEKGSTAKVKFFGAKTEAVDFVFVIDNSNSMSRGRFETALNELVKAVNNLNKRQRFYVIFYSDTAYPLFHPQSPSSLVPATTRNKQRLSQWLATVPLCLKTNGREALQLGLGLKPDVMFVLGDGAFTDDAARFFVANPVKGVVIHTLGMEVSPNNAERFKALAKSHEGTYQDVGVYPQAAVLAKQFPRRRNRFRDGYWGLKLPVANPNN